MRNSEAKWDRLFELIEKEAKYYNHGIARLAWDYYDENQKFCLYKIEYSKDQPKQPINVKYDYGDFKLIKRTLSVTDSNDLLTKIRNNKLHVDDDVLDILVGPLTQSFIPSDESFGLINTDWPTHYFECLLQNPPFKSIANYILNAKLNLPLYSTILDATADFLDINSNDYSINSRIIILMPDFRARIKELHIIGKKLIAFLETAELDVTSELIVKFHCKRKLDKKQSSQDVIPKNNLAEHIEEFEPDSARVVLFLRSKDKEEILDEKKFEGLYTYHRSIIIKAPEDHINEIIKAGENDRTEFKLSIDDELPETLVSFANTSGGLIFLGVDDKGNTRGFVHSIGDESKIEKKLFGLAKSHCEPMIDFKTEWVTINDQTLLLISVFEGKDKPYNYRNKGIYIREREHDNPIDRRKLDEIYSKKPNIYSTDI